MNPEISTFFSDVVIVCTLAILIGQDLRVSLKEAIDKKKEDIRECIYSLSKGKEYIENESIKETYDEVKNYDSPDLWYYPMLFYVGIMLALLLNLICMNQHLKIVDVLQECEIEKWRFLLLISVFITLFCYGLRLIQMHKNYDAFCKNSYNFTTNLQLVDKLVVKNHKPSETPSSGHKKKRK